MRRYPEFAPLGFHAAISEAADGDCGWGSREGERERLLSAFGASLDQLVQVRQIHGNDVVFAWPGDAGRGARGGAEALGDADGIATAAKGLVLGIAVADCVPLFLMDPATGMGALLHAGREGTHLNIAGRALALMAELGGVDPGTVHALIGPSAGVCCYEVSAAMAEQWEGAGWVRQGRHLDLWATNRRQLIAGGVGAAHIMIDGICTICQPGFHSYRREGGTARNLALLQIGC